MARYADLLGRRIEVQYRAGDIFLPAVGTLVADSGKSIFLEEHFCQRGQMKNFRWEIPYQCIIQIAESAPVREPPSPVPASPRDTDAAAEQVGILPLKNHPEEA